MFDPSVPIYTAMILSNFSAGINDGAFICGPLYITVNSNHKIILNWDLHCVSVLKPGIVKIWYICGDNNKLCEDGVELDDVSRGSYEANITSPLPSNYYFPAGWDKDSPRAIPGAYCMPLVIESLRNGRVVDRRCLRIYPSWMQNYGNLRLGELMIPGTHNSGAWTGAADLISNFVYNQDRDLYEQLVFGQRYFDIRLGIVEEDYHITHNIIPTSKLETELENIAKFARKSPKEIIIVDVHKFNLPINFGMEEHEGALGLFVEKLGKYMIPKLFSGIHARGPKLSELWRTGKNVIVAYSSREIAAASQNLWPPIRRSWGDKIVESELLDYIMAEAKKSDQTGNPMKVLMAELTPNAKYIVTNPSKGLGYLADIINQNITYWLSDNNISNKFNIIATDFFLGNRLVEYAVKVNDEKLATL